MNHKKWVNHLGTIHMREEESARYICGQPVQPKDKPTNLRLGFCNTCKRSLKVEKRMRKHGW